jgi:hypothetical protein
MIGADGRAADDVVEAMKKIRIWRRQESMLIDRRTMKEVLYSR